MTTERVKIEGASQITGVPEGTLRFWRATNQGPRSYVVGRRLWYDVGDLEAWLEDQKAQSVRGAELVGVHGERRC
jgi:DNA-binding transcriptional MerR regulator